MTTVSFLVKINSILYEELFSKTYFGCTASYFKLYDVSVGFVSPPSFEAVYCYICGRRGVAVARYRMICLVLVNSILHQYREHINYLHVESTCHAFSKVVSKTFTLKQVYSKSTSIVFHRTISPSPDLEPALAQRFRPWIAQCTHIVTGYPNIVWNDKLRDLQNICPKYKVPVFLFNATELWYFEPYMHARWSTKKEDIKIDTLSERIKMIHDRKCAKTQNPTTYMYILSTSDTSQFPVTLILSEWFVIVSANKSSNTYTFVCKKYYAEVLML